MNRFDKTVELITFAFRSNIINVQTTLVVLDKESELKNVTALKTLLFHSVLYLPLVGHHSFSFANFLFFFAHLFSGKCSS